MIRSNPAPSDWSLKALPRDRGGGRQETAQLRILSSKYPVFDEVTGAKSLKHAFPSKNAVI